MAGLGPALRLVTRLTERGQDDEQVRNGHGTVEVHVRWAKIGTGAKVAGAVVKIGIGVIIGRAWIGATSVVHEHTGPVIVSGNGLEVDGLC